MEHKLEEKWEWLNKDSLNEEQIKVDVERYALLSEIPEDYREKITLVEKVLAELAQAGIPAYIYVGLQTDPSVDKWINVFQYNTLPALLSHKETGEMEDESMENLSKFHSAVNYGFFKTITVDGSYARHLGIHKLDWRIADNFEKVMGFFMKTVYSSLRMFTEYRYGKPTSDDNNIDVS